MLIRPHLHESIGDSALPLHGKEDDFDSLLECIGDARFVLIGEASHGTHDFYNVRTEITKRLICEKGFCAVAVEADWPDAYRVNRYVQELGADSDAAEALGGFIRFPTWMWRNADVLDFVGWLRSFNDYVFDPAKKVGFYGLDLYSLQASMQAVIHYLEKVDPPAAQRARDRYACFDRFGSDPHLYARSALSYLDASCRQEVIDQLSDLQSHSQGYLKVDGQLARDELFCAKQNARLVKNAENYYRTMFENHVSSWNNRDQHMFDTFRSLKSHLDHSWKRSKIVVWAHNSHLGDATATHMSEDGEINVGQLIRQAYGTDSFSIGFTTYQGSVTAASDWGASVERKQIRPGLKGSVEELFHLSGHPKFILNFRNDPLLARTLDIPLLERAIGVIYRPDSERYSHYFEAHISRQFDAVIHLDKTRAVEPLERNVEWDLGDWPETYPSGI